MGAEVLTTYLNDHLAGSVVALELLEHLAQSSKEREEKVFFQRLAAEIGEDKDDLRKLLHSLGAKESKTRKVAAWLTEKLAEAKLKLEDPGTGDLRLLEALETLALGIQGKQSLWRALGTITERVDQIRQLDLDRLQRRAQGQYEAVETRRLEAARRALRV